MSTNSENNNTYGLKSTEIDLGNIPVDSDRLLIKRIFELLSEEKAEEIIFIDAKYRSSLADFLIVCQGRSQLHCKYCSKCGI